MMTFASMKDQFAAKNAALLGLSVDSNPSHIDWVRTMGNYSWNGINKPQVSFPIIADDFGTVSRMYGMLMPSASATKTVRNVYMIDPDGVVRAILIYPLTTGRNMNEIYRLLLALQAYDQTGDATPANWQPGESRIMPIPQTVPVSTQRLDDQKTGGYACVDWYLCFTAGGERLSMPSQPAQSAAAAPTAQVMQMPPVVSANGMLDQTPVAAPQPVRSPARAPADAVQSTQSAGKDPDPQPAMPGGFIVTFPQPGRPFSPFSPEGTVPVVPVLPRQGVPGRALAPDTAMQPAAAQSETGTQATSPAAPKQASAGRQATHGSIMDQNRNMINRNSAKNGAGRNEFPYLRDNRLK